MWWINFKVAAGIALLSCVSICAAADVEGLLLQSEQLYEAGKGRAAFEKLSEKDLVDEKDTWSAELLEQYGKLAYFTGKIDVGSVAYKEAAKLFSKQRRDFRATLSVIRPLGEVSKIGACEAGEALIAEYHSFANVLKKNKWYLDVSLAGYSGILYRNCNPKLSQEKLKETIGLAQQLDATFGSFFLHVSVENAMLPGERDFFAAVNQILINGAGRYYPEKGPAGIEDRYVFLLARQLALNLGNTSLADHLGRMARFEENMDVPYWILKRDPDWRLASMDSSRTARPN